MSALDQQSPAGRDRSRFDDDWRFSKGDVTAGEQPGLDDSTWRALDLPHDWAIEGAFDKTFNPHTGGLDVAGPAWYRKHFRLPASERGRHHSIEFDGAMANARVFLNGRELGGRPYGYIGFAFDLEPGLVFGDPGNVLAVRLCAGARVIALVSRRRHLSPHLAASHGRCARRQVGHVRHDPRCVG